MRNNIKNDMSIPTVNYDGWYFFAQKSETEQRILYIERHFYERW